MDPLLLMLPTAIGAATCANLAKGYAPKQAIRASIAAVPAHVWKRMPSTDTAGAIGQMAFYSSLQQCPEQWQRHTSRPVFSL